MDDLISYCKETGVITQFTDLNTGKILNHCGFPEYQERIKELHSHNHGDNMFLKQFTPDDMKNTQEEKAKNNLIQAPHNVQDMLDILMGNSG